MRIRFVFDASSLIHLAKSGLSSLIEELEGEKYVVPAVSDEVVRRGKELGHEDAVGVESLIERGILKVRSVSKVVARSRGLNQAEVGVISLAKEIEGIAVLDDAVARSVARLNGVRIEGTYGIILRALADGRISRSDAEAALEKLVSSGWRCDVELYARLLKLTKEIESEVVNNGTLTRRP